MDFKKKFGKFSKKKIAKLNFSTKKKDLTSLIFIFSRFMVLFLFVIMMFDLKRNQPESKSSLTKLAGSVVAGTLLVLFVAILRKNNLPVPSEVNFKSQTGMVETLGKMLYSEYLLPFELISILFFVAMVGAVMLGKREAGERNF
jgi:NADH-quinone oxidoreductase subunit J